MDSEKKNLNTGEENPNLIYSSDESDYEHKKNSMKIKDKTIKKKTNEEKILDLKKINRKKYKLIMDNEKIKQKIENEITNNCEEIMNLCEHKWEMIVPYGERTYYECVKCRNTCRRPPTNY